jgi:effector-binding domain-containing protein
MNMPENITIEHKRIDTMLVAMRRLVVRQRDDLQLALQELSRQIPQGNICGPAFAIFWFVTSIKDGFEVDAGYPVIQPFEKNHIRSVVYPSMEVLSAMHRGPANELRNTLLKVHGFAGEHAIISDEFRREVYWDGDDPKGSRIEVQFIVHNWHERLARNLERVLGSNGNRTVMQGCDALTLQSSPEERFKWTKDAVERLELLANPYQQYDILSSCAHVFPQAQIDKLAATFNQAIKAGKTGLQAVDAVIDFMGQDPGWGERPRREGRIIFSAKNPRDPEGYAKAANPLEKRRAYCFCPLLRDHMDQGMPLSFCNCGAGWYRQQWEGATGKPIRIEIVKSVSRGDDACEFAIHLAPDL